MYKPATGFTYTFAGNGYCNDYIYLPEGAYPPLLTPDSPLFNADRLRECGNRCRAAALDNMEYSPYAFYVNYAGRCGCAKSQCYSQTAGFDTRFMAFRMKNND